MQLVWLALLTIVAVLSGASFCTAKETTDKATGSPETPAATALDGKAIYTARCAACHQASGKGLPGAFPPIAGAEVPNGPAAEHMKIVLDGQTGPVKVLGKPYNGVMPGWKGQLSAAEIAAVVTYERTAFGNKGGAVTADDVAKLGGEKQTP